MTKLDLLNRWWRYSERYIPPRPDLIPIGAGEFDSWLPYHLYGHASITLRDGMTREEFEAKMHEERRKQISWHNSLRANDIHWARSSDFCISTVERIVREAESYLVRK